MACEQHLGGNSKVGPFATKSQCQDWIATKLSNYPYRECYGSDDGGASSAGASDSSLIESSSRAMSYGLQNGDGGMFGLGLLGLGTQAMLNSSNSGPSPEQQEAARQAEQARIARYQAEQAAKKRKLEADKADIEGDMKGVPHAAEARPEDFGLKGDGSDDLKDGLKDGPTKHKKKPFHPPHLKPVANPLYKDARPEDFTGGRSKFRDWEEAKVFTRANGGTLARKDNGEITWCPDGYPYSCNNQCYTEAALNDFRIPCNSTLKTLKPED